MFAIIDIYWKMVLMMYYNNAAQTPNTAAAHASYVEGII